MVINQLLTRMILQVPPPKEGAWLDYHVNLTKKNGETWWTSRVSKYITFVNTILTSKLRQL